VKLFVGLGNPGQKYARNRHNVGFMAVDRIAERHGLSSWRRRFEGEAAEGSIGNERVLMLKPATYMNDSGRSVVQAVRFHKLDLADVIVIHDEVDLAPGRIKVKTGGGNAGHNGLRSISAHIGNDYVRLRIGVGHPGVKELVPNWVLHDFVKADAKWLDPLIAAVAEAAPYLAMGQAPRFQSEVARLLQPEKKPAAAEARKADEAAPARQKDASPASGKPETALGARLKNWIKGKPGA
jgi:PTH1 family peptidyl-tRNA hydrolase